uniref:Nudix hydrolase domain-containing protein n=1 Tax=Haptolina ericina TaxID=156174 RepID=A0A7S3AML4_9EUKA|mmetsp:Transcript_26513/g.60010  ORF Transcript_26513/g.60010 Transcript_26513/m.60010 type:complete len:351 (+) Transcript_26513:44-1096(+)
MLSRAKVSIHVGFGFGALVATLVYATRYRRHGGRLVRIQLWLGALLRPVMSTAHRSTPATQAPYNLLLTLTGAGDGLRGGVPAEAMSISCGLAHDRKVHMTDSRIEDCWNTKMATGSKLFDQSKFRLRRISWAGAGASVTIELGLTSYKEYIGTHRLPPDELAVLEGDGTVLGDLRAHLSCALGCEAVLLTCDGFMVLLRRSGRVATHSGMYNGPSGHAEPAHAGIQSHLGHGEVGSVTEAEREQAVKNELFGSILAEVHDETNVPRQSLSSPLLIGAMEDASRKPDLLFLVHTSLDCDGVKIAMSKGAAEGWESDRLVFWPLNELDGIDLPLTPVTAAAIHCLKLRQPQ